MKNNKKEQMKVITFGEIMLRLSTDRHLRFGQARNFSATYGGGEFNVSVSLSNYGIPTDFVTRIPENDLGISALREIRKYNVGTQHIAFGGDRLGVYFLETGAGTRGSKVVYDRAHSAFSEIETGSIDWESVFDGATWFHWSGVTPAVSANAAAVCLEAVKAARKYGVKVSADLNYRSKLWKYGKEPHEIMPEILKYSHVILGDLDTAYFMMGEEKPNPDYQQEDSLPDLYRFMFDKCPDLECMATTLRYSVSASHQKIGGVLFDGEQLYSADVQEVTPVVDRVGSGDAFMGGLIYSLIKKKDKQKALNFAVAACCLKHTIWSDFNLVSVEEVESLASGNYSGKVMR